MSWRHKQEWTTGVYDARRPFGGQQLATVYVDVQHMPEREGGVWAWTVGAYLYRGHLFDAIETDRISDAAIGSAPFHGGCTLNNWLRVDGGKVASKRIAADYAHLHDATYCQGGTREHAEAMGIFRDAEALRDWILAQERANTGGE